MSWMKWWMYLNSLQSLYQFNGPWNCSDGVIPNKQASKHNFVSRLPPPNCSDMCTRNETSWAGKEGERQLMSISFLHVALYPGHFAGEKIFADHMAVWRKLFSNTTSSWISKFLGSYDICSTPIHTISSQNDKCLQQSCDLSVLIKKSEEEGEAPKPDETQAGLLTLAEGYVCTLVVVVIHDRGSSSSHIHTTQPPIFDGPIFWSPYHSWWSLVLVETYP